MPSIPKLPKYTHADVVNFVKEGIAPEDLTCSIGLGLVTRPVRMHGDTVGRTYEAETARKALDLQHQNPFNREPITAHPALLQDADHQKDVLQFRAMVLGYTKVAAYLNNRDPLNPGALLMPGQAAAGVSLKAVALGQRIRNNQARRKARQPIVQPELAEFRHNRAFDAQERALELVPRARTVAANGLAAAEEAQQVANAAAPRHRGDRWVFGDPREDAAQELRAMGIPPGPFEQTFGAEALVPAAEVVTDPTAARLGLLKRVAERSGRSLSDALLFESGGLLRQILKDRNYEGLAALAPTLPARATSHWQIGTLANADHIYIGEHRAGIPEGLGVYVRPSQGGYHGGEFHAGLLNGSGRKHAGPGAAAGLWENGKLRQGTLTDGHQQVRGNFVGYMPNGLAEVRTRIAHSYGYWHNGLLIRGMAELPYDTTSLLWETSRADNEVLGQVESANHADGLYHGALRNYMPHGFGVNTDGAGVERAGRWQNGVLLGPGSQVFPDRILLGTWNHPNDSGRERFVLEEEVGIEDDARPVQDVLDHPAERALDDNARLDAIDW